MHDSKLRVKDLLAMYAVKKKEIRRRVREFMNFINRSDEEIFAELSFCLCTPQSKATVCWNAISSLMKNRLLFQGSTEEITPYLKGVRFKKTKATYIVEARKFFTDDGRLKIKDKLLALKAVSYTHLTLPTKA